MVRTHPVRTGLFSAGPILFGLFMFANNYANDGSMLFSLAFLAVMAAFAAMVTRYHLVTFRLDQLRQSVEDLE